MPTDPQIVWVNESRRIWSTWPDFSLALCPQCEIGDAVQTAAHDRFLIVCQQWRDFRKSANEHFAIHDLVELRYDVGRVAERGDSSSKCLKALLEEVERGLINHTAQQTLLPTWNNSFKDANTAAAAYIFYIKFALMILLHLHWCFCSFFVWCVTFLTWTWIFLMGLIIINYLFLWKEWNQSETPSTVTWTQLST